MDVVSVSPAVSSESTQQEQSSERNALASEASSDSDYLRCACSESSSFIMAQPKIAVDAPSKLWITTVFVVIVVLQVASTTGLFVYLNMSVAQVNDLILFLMHDNN